MRQATRSEWVAFPVPRARGCFSWRSPVFPRFIDRSTMSRRECILSNGWQRELALIFASERGGRVEMNARRAERPAAANKRWRCRSVVHKYYLCSVLLSCCFDWPAWRAASEHEPMKAWSRFASNGSELSFKGIQVLETSFLNYTVLLSISKSE